MNKIIVVLFTIALMSNSVLAQKISAEKVPAAVISAFNAKFPTALNTSWEMEDANEFEARFTLNKKEVSANFENTGKWLETETEIMRSDFPAAVQTAISKDFAGFKIEGASKIESLINWICFEAEIEKGADSYDVLFTPDGKLLSKTKVVDERDKD